MIRRKRDDRGRTEKSKGLAPPGRQRKGAGCAGAVRGYARGKIHLCGGLREKCIVSDGGKNLLSTDHRQQNFLKTAGR